MKRPVLLRPEVRGELVEAWAWYEARRAGLGDSMVTCLEAAVAIAARTPEAFPVVHGEARRVLVRRFPYGVYYVVEDDVLVSTPSTPPGGVAGTGRRRRARGSLWLADNLAATDRKDHIKR